MARPVVDEKLCIGCPVCVEVCPKGVFEIRNEIAFVINPEDCDDCEICITGCAQMALSLINEENESFDIDEGEEELDF